jgi:tetratricopeptide (TPR) repeat protein
MTLNAADPMPRLGLGLARIRTGELAEGRVDLEAAVALDSNNALLRAYLGKAYFEEIRAPLDAEQLDIAKDLDPLDPTAFLYNAIRLQTENQPVAALRDLEASIEKNDNRAVFRGRLLLDQDRAARGANLAQIYRDLGFTRSGIGVARSSITLDPGSASAHRFLSESYASVRRREISRVSELLQAQMLQDININPIQPSVSETNLNTLTRGGPASVGYNEFTPLFERNAVQADATGLAGNNGTVAGEGVISAVYDRLSLSAGYYQYETDGWRDNNDLTQEIANVYGQMALTPELNVQAEFRRRESTEGDLAFNFDPERFLDDKTIDRKQDTARLGLRYSPSPSSDILLSYIHSDRTDALVQTEPLDPFTTASVDNVRNDQGDQIEAQYIYRRPRLNLVAGLAYSDVDVQEDTDIRIEDPSLPFPLLEVTTTESGKIRHPRGYFYGNVQVSSSIVATLGASYDDYEEEPLAETGFNPKFGVQWRISDRLSLRAAAFRTMKPALVNNRTLEPTQVAGFNQLFDDINATKSTRYGVGLDSALTADLIVGAELTRRDLDEPVVRPFEGDVVFEGREEELHRAYLYWTPDDRVAVSGELVYDLWRADKGIATAFDNLPELVETISLPLGVTYYLPNGLSAGIAGTYVDQRVQRSELATQADGSDSFFLVDASMAYRLPKRLGTVALQVRNLFGEEFQYQDDSYREFRDEPSTGPYFPETTFWAIARLTF